MWADYFIFLIFASQEATVTIICNVFSSTVSPTIVCVVHMVEGNKTFYIIIMYCVCVYPIKSMFD